MADNHDLSDLAVPARSIPVPVTVSAEARQFLGAPQRIDQWPDLADLDAVKALIAEREREIYKAVEPRLRDFPARVDRRDLENCALYTLVPESLSPGLAGRVIYYVHGGAYLMMGGPLAAEAAKPLAHVAGCTTISVDYRLAPDHPFPAALDDAVAGYRLVVEEYGAANVVVAGASAGGGLAAATILKARDIGLPMPAAAVLHTPEVDLTESGDSFETNQVIDVVLKRRLTPSIALYAGGEDLRNPYLSPVFADFGAGFPPTLLSTGTRDLFLSNTAIMHRALRRAGIAAELHVFEAMPHGGFMGAPEDMELLEEQAHFIRRHLGA
jgi:acetyl esterase/lipase